jgi:hypothetical protein
MVDDEWDLAEIVVTGTGLGRRWSGGATLVDE